MHKSEFLQQNLLLIREIISNGYFLVSLDFLSIFLVFCGIIVIISKNPAQEIQEISDPGPLFFSKLVLKQTSLLKLVSRSKKKLNYKFNFFFKLRRDKLFRASRGGGEK